MYSDIKALDKWFRIDYDALEASDKESKMLTINNSTG